MAEQLHLSAYLYREDAVRTAAAAYAEIATIEVAASADEICVTLACAPSFDGTPGELRDSFANHALYETVVAERRAAQESASP